MLHIPLPPPEGFVRKPRWELVPENLDELNEIFESETEREDEISNTDVMQKTNFWTLQQVKMILLVDGLQAYSAIRSVLHYILGKQRNNF